MDKTDAARLLGVPVTEIAEVLDSPAGDLITTADGQTYVHLPDDQPDASGRTGLMFLQPPHDRYVGSFPVYDGTVTVDPGPAEVAPKRRKRTTQPAEPTTSDQQPTGAAGDAGDGVAGDDPAEVLAAELAALDKDELLAVARDRGIDVQPTWAAERIIEAILDAAADLTPATGGDS